MATYWENSCSFDLRYVSWYKYLIVSLFFSHLGFWSGNLFLISPFPDLCLLVPFFVFRSFSSINLWRQTFRFEDVFTRAFSLKSPPRIITWVIYNFLKVINFHLHRPVFEKKVQVGKDQEKAQSEKESHSKNQGGKKPN